MHAFVREEAHSKCRKRDLSKKLALVSINLCTRAIDYQGLIFFLFFLEGGGEVLDLKHNNNALVKNKILK